MSASETGRELAATLKRLREAHPGVAPEAGPPSTIDPAEPLLALLVRSFLLWESTSGKAVAAMRKLEAAVVDFNELRACMPDELVRIVGERYPRGAERALRLRTALNVLFARHHAVTLEPLRSADGPAAREALSGLDGVPPFVAARVCLLGLGIHAAPVDSRILRRLAEARVVPDDAGIEQAATLLERKVRPGELPQAYALLQAWADEAAYPPAESHLADLRPRHKPVAKHVREQAELERRAARKSKLRPARKKKPAADKRDARKRPGRGR